MQFPNPGASQYLLEGEETNFLGGNLMTRLDTFSRRTVLATATALGSLGLFAGSLAAQATWPNGTVQLVVPAAPGGGTDAVARIIAEALQNTSGAPFVVVNTPGGGGAVAAEMVRNSDSDGQNLLFFHSGILSAYHTGAYAHDPAEAFTVISAMPSASTISVAVRANSPYQTVADLVAAATESPNRITFGVQIRGASHFIAGLLEQDSGARFRIVEAGSDSDKLVQLQGGQIEAALVNTPGTLQYVQNGDLRILGVVGGTEDRDPTIPDMPTVAEQGYPSVIYGLDFLVLGPQGMDPATVEAIHAAFEAVATNEATLERLRVMNMPISTTTIEEGRARLAAQSESTRVTAQALGLN